jgi:hypothetical protein
MEAAYTEFGRRVWLWLVDNYGPRTPEPLMEQLADIAVEAGLLEMKDPDDLDEEE